MIRENTFRLVGPYGTRTLLLLAGTVSNNGNESCRDFVSNPHTYLARRGFHYHYQDPAWIVYEKRLGFQEWFTVQFSAVDNPEKRDIELRGIEQAVRDERWLLQLKIE